MYRNNGKPELLSPAGNMEKLRAAVLYGADAVYLAGKRFGMRAASGNFTNEELAEAVDFCHERGVRVYAALNVMPRTSEYPELKAYILFLSTVGVDAVIVADMGVFYTVRETAPSLEIHISTQMSAVSAAACTALYKMGAKRVVLARELTLEEILEIRRGTPPELELEAFIHGAMCVSYSGRCLLSNYFTGRDANHGECAQPCRWVYSDAVRKLDLSEERRPDIPVVLTAEEEGGETFFMSSRDTCMIRHIPELENSGISSYKIEGRVKSAYYTAVVTNAYRMAIDAYRRLGNGYRFDPLWERELESVSHREYGTGFYFASPHEDANTVSRHGYIREKAYLATAMEDSTPAGEMWDTLFVQRNKLEAGDIAEIISPGMAGRPFRADSLRDENGEAIGSTPHAGMKFRLMSPFPVKAGDILRGGDADGARL